ncbi:MAG: NAD(+) diphosphatase [Gammaproteobacteria bacterium]|nr:NAD(+) diphosphatase [Gammaproteobacteria bacterium]
MPTKPHFFASHHFDRMAHRRDQDTWLEQRRSSGNCWFLPVAGSNNLVVKGPPPAAALLTLEQVSKKLSCTQIYLGEYKEKSCFALLTEHEHDSNWPDTEYQQVLRVATLIDIAEASLLAYARGMSIWHRNHRHCGRCGASTVSSRAGHVLTCSDADCSWQQFPRVDPAIIVLVSDGERCLLGRQESWDQGRYSTIAGFVEPGESLEDAVIREVYEETGIVARSPVYHSSQPWPFPSSLMLGFQASAASSDIQLHDGELEHADWFSPEDLASGKPIRLAPSVSISRQLINHWYYQQTGRDLDTSGTPPKAW